MKKVVVTQFGDIDTLTLAEAPTPQPGTGEVLVRLTSIGMNHADLMSRRGEYKLSSGEPPFTPGLEGGGVIEAVGEGVATRAVGDRVILGPQFPRPAAGPHGGTYRSHCVCAVDTTWPAPDALADEHLGAIWLAYLTAYGCLVYRQDVQAGDVVAMPAASCAVALAAAQIASSRGAVTIGLTSSPDKVDLLDDLPAATYSHLLATGETRWDKELRNLTDGHGVDVFFDPVAAGDYLNQEIRALATGGTVWVYGLLGKLGMVNVWPLIVKAGAIRGWLYQEIMDAGGDVLRDACADILRGFTDGLFQVHVDRVFQLDEAQAAHEYLAAGRHIGKVVLVP